MRELLGGPSLSAVLLWGACSVAACATYQDDVRASSLGQERGGEGPIDMAGSSGKADGGNVTGGSGAASPVGGESMGGAGAGKASGGGAGIGGESSTAGAGGNVEPSAGSSNIGGGSSGTGGGGAGGTGGSTGGGAGSGEMGGGGTGGSSSCSQEVPSRATWSVSASITNMGEPVGSAIDGNDASRWSTGVPQAGGEWFEVDFGVSANVSEVVLDVASSASDFPNKYAVRLSDSAHDGSSKILAMGAGSTGALKIALPDHPKGRYLRVEQTGSSSAWWSIAELSASCSP